MATYATGLTARIFLRELIKTMSVAGEDAYTPHTSQVLCEQCSALHETLGC